MNNEEKLKTCAKVDPGTLILYAYGEESPPGLHRHLEECASCRAFLSELDRTRKLAAAAGREEPSSRGVDLLKAEAAKKAERLSAELKGEPQERKAIPLPRPRKERGPGNARSRLFTARPAWALAAALVLALSALVFMEARKKPAPGPSSRQEIPGFLADVSSQLAALEQSVETAAWAVLGESAEEESLLDTTAEVESLEIALAELEEEILPPPGKEKTGMNQSPVPRTWEQAGMETESPEEEEDFSIPLLPGLVNDTSL